MSSSIRLQRIPRFAVRFLANSLGLRRKPKVFAIGFNKCATTSLHALFSEVGLLSYHGTRWRQCDNLWLLRTFDCFSDGIPKDLAKLDRLFPQSKFILQVRDLESWVYSRLAHIDRSRKQSGYRLSSDWDTTDSAVKSWILQRNSYHLFVHEYFSQRPDDLLVVNFIRDPAAGTRVANFLGYQGDHDRPMDNVNPEKTIPAAHVEILHRCATELGIPTHEFKHDIYCPSLLAPANSVRLSPDSA